MYTRKQILQHVARERERNERDELERDLAMVEIEIGFLSENLLERLYELGRNRPRRAATEQVKSRQQTQGLVYKTVYNDGRRD